LAADGKEGVFSMLVAVSEPAAIANVISAFGLVANRAIGTDRSAPGCTATLPGWGEIQGT
jgi:hypothetical protein